MVFIVGITQINNILSSKNNCQLSFEILDKLIKTESTSFINNNNNNNN